LGLASRLSLKMKSFRTINTSSSTSSTASESQSPDSSFESTNTSETEQHQDDLSYSNETNSLLSMTHSTFLKSTGLEEYDDELQDFERQALENYNPDDETTTTAGGGRGDSISPRSNVSGSNSSKFPRRRTGSHSIAEDDLSHDDSTNTDISFSLDSLSHFGQQLKAQQKQFLQKHKKKQQQPPTDNRNNGGGGESGGEIGMNPSTESFIPPEIEMLHMEADLLLETIRHGITPKMNASHHNNSNASLSQKEVNINTNNDNDNENNNDHEDDLQSLTTIETDDDDGMKAEVQNLGRAVLNLRRDLDLTGLNIPMGADDHSLSSFITMDAEGGGGGGGMRTRSSSHSSISGVGQQRRMGIRQMLSNVVEEVGLTLKALRQLNSRTNTNTSTVTEDDNEDDLEGGVTRTETATVATGASPRSDAIRTWAPSVLWAISIMIAGLYFRASISSGEFGDLEGLDMLQNLEWMLFPKE
jgi:hypothetical protein